MDDKILKAVGITVTPEQQMQLADAQFILMRRETILRNREKAQERHEAILQGFANDLRALQEECPHLTTTHHAAEGNDSEDRCDQCGVDVRAQERRRLQVERKVQHG